jgi:hypothetical protein
MNLLKTATTQIEGALNLLNAVREVLGKNQALSAAQTSAREPADIKPTVSVPKSSAARRKKSAPKAMALRPGPNPCNRIHVKGTRDQKFAGCAVIVGSGRNARSHMHATTGISVATDKTPDMIDPVKLAKELDVEMCAVNRGRIWTIDEAEFLGGYIVDFHGVKMTWVGEMVAANLLEQFHNAYLPSLIQRFTAWTYYVGKPIHVLREPGGPVWVMQEYTKAVDSTLNINNLHTVGKKLKNLPKGWKFETIILTEELVLDTMRSDGWASILRDELGCTYQACGYGGDTSANYIP